MGASAGHLDERPNTRERILTAALECFARKGFHGASMHDICAAAAVSPGGLYRHFSAKDDLIVALVEADREHALGLIDRALADADPWTGMRALVRAACQDFFDAKRSAMRLEVSAEASRNPRARAAAVDLYRAAIDALTRHIEAGQQAGAYGRALSAEALARVLIALGDGVGCWFALETPPAVEELEAWLLHAIERLLRPDAADPKD